MFCRSLGFLCVSFRIAFNDHFEGRCLGGELFQTVVGHELQKECTGSGEIAQILLPLISRQRKRSRGYDQVELIAKALSRELGIPAAPVLKKIRHTPPQSSLKSAAERRATVLGAYRVIAPDAVSGKRLLLLDDVITTGATASECARMLTMAGAAAIDCAAVSVAPHDKKENK